MNIIDFLIVYGGRNEYAISHKSALFIYETILASKLKIQPMFLSIGEKGCTLHSFDRKIEAPVLIVRDGIILPNNNFVKVNSAINIIHSSEIIDFGFQLSLLSSFGIPTISSSPETLHITVDKANTYLFIKNILKNTNIKCVKKQLIFTKEEIPKTIHENAMVKARTSGSNFSLSYCNTREKIQSYLNYLFDINYPPFIVEDYIEHDIEISIFIVKIANKISISKPIILGNKLVDDQNFYKSLRFLTKNETAIYNKQLIHTSLEIFKKLPGRFPFLRVDYMLSKDGVLYFNELESNPGFTKHSIVNFDSEFNAADKLIKLIEEILPNNKR